MTKYVLIFILLLYLAGCEIKNNKKGQNNYQESIQLDSLTMIFMASDHDTCGFYTRRYSNGGKLREGKICHDLKEGMWREWYTNGTLLDSGYYERGIRIYDKKMNELLQTAYDSLKSKSLIRIIFKENSSKFKVGHAYAFSVDMNGCLFDHRDICDYLEKGNKEMYKINTIPYPVDSFLFEFTPLQSGDQELVLAFNRKIQVRPQMLNNEWTVIYDKALKIEN